jgi:endonuclease/exonuclease/phosphatase family metal-dependent hydrolase
MRSWNDDVLLQTVPRLTPVSLAERQAILASPFEAENHRGHFDRLAVVREIEVGELQQSRQIEGPARIAFWNVERLRHIDAITSTLQGLEADVTLLCEVDRGMARTRNRDGIVELAGSLDQAYLYAVEFVELGLGDRNEQVIHAGENNTEGFHGAALLSAAEMANPFLIRLDARGDWFDGTHGERRIGGTIALGAKIAISGQWVTMVSVHLESHCDPDIRGHEMERMLQIIETIALGEPVILGGDFNTSTAPFAKRRDDPAAWLNQLARETDRLTRPERYEPLFEAAREYGYEWQNCNVAEKPTQRFAEGSTRLPAKLDWFFTRGMEVSEARIVEAVRPDGQPSSDHEALFITTIPR